jgi:hypothetical protein
MSEIRFRGSKRSAAHGKTRATTEPPTDVFISHSNQDKTVANAMRSRFEQAGNRCWIAPRDVRPGRNWGSEIIRGLDNAKVMIVVLSASANDSRPVKKEVERAFDKEIVIIGERQKVGGRAA